jgi:hypothetical protein
VLKAAAASSSLYLSDPHLKPPYHPTSQTVMLVAVNVLELTILKVPEKLQTRTSIE